MRGALYKLKIEPLTVACLLLQSCQFHSSSTQMGMHPDSTSSKQKPGLAFENVEDPFFLDAPWTTSVGNTGHSLNSKQPYPKTIEQHDILKSQSPVIPKKSFQIKDGRTVKFLTDANNHVRALVEDKHFNTKTNVPVVFKNSKADFFQALTRENSKYLIHTLFPGNSTLPSNHKALLCWQDGLKLKGGAYTVSTLENSDGEYNNEWDAGSNRFDGRDWYISFYKSKYGYWKAKVTMKGETVHIDVLSSEPLSLSYNDLRTCKWRFHWKWFCWAKWADKITISTSSSDIKYYKNQRYKARKQKEDSRRQKLERARELARQRAEAQKKEEERKKKEEERADRERLEELRRERMRELYRLEREAEAIREREREREKERLRIERLERQIAEEMDVDVIDALETLKAQSEARINVLGVHAANEENARHEEEEEKRKKEEEKRKKEEEERKKKEEERKKKEEERKKKEEERKKKEEERKKKEEERKKKEEEERKKKEEERKKKEMARSQALMAEMEALEQASEHSETEQENQTVEFDGLMGAEDELQRLG